MKILKKLLIIVFIGVSICACETTPNKRVKVEDFTVNMKSPQSSIGEVELQLDPLLGIGKLTKQTVTVLYFPKEDAVCLKYKHEFFTYHQFWDKKGRLNFINALQKYNEDYEARNLQRKTNKTTQKYGTVRGYIVWQQASFTVQARASTNIDLGYNFKDKSPYFTIHQRTAEFTEDNSRETRTSSDVNMYLTRAQAAELAEIFEQYIFSDTYDDEYEEPDKPDTPKKKDDIPRDDY